MQIIKKAKYKKIFFYNQKKEKKIILSQFLIFIKKLHIFNFILHH